MNVSGLSVVMLVISVLLAANVRSASAQQEMFLVCPHGGWCAGVSSDGVFYSGDPQLSAAFFKKEANLFSGLTKQQVNRRRMTSFYCWPSEWCIGTDNMGGIYAGQSRRIGGGELFFRRRN